MPRKRKSTSQQPQGRNRASRTSSSTVSPLTIVFDEEDLVTEILKFVVQDELDTCALVSHVFSAARDRPVFDQTRAGTIVFRTLFHEIPVETWNRWNQQVFTGNRTRLVAVFTTLNSDLPHLPHNTELLIKLTNVRHLVLRRDPSIPVPRSILERDFGGMAIVSFFKAITPNLDILDMGTLAKTTPDTNLLNFYSTSALFNLHASVFRCIAKDEEQDIFRVNQPCLSVFVRQEGTRLREFHVDPFGVYFDNVEGPPVAAYCNERHELEDVKSLLVDGSFTFQRYSRDYILLRLLVAPNTWNAAAIKPFRMIIGRHSHRKSSSSLCDTVPPSGGFAVI